MFDTYFSQISHVEYIFKLYVEWMQRNLDSFDIALLFIVECVKVSMKYELAK